MSNFFDLVIEETGDIVKSIYDHPFIRELSVGSLSQELFTYYIEQDTYYLVEFSRCLSIIASKCDSGNIKSFLSFAEEALGELEPIHNSFMNNKGNNINAISPANLFYTSYLKSVCSMEPVSIGIAAVLPCFFIYRDVGSFISTNRIHDNPYNQWIDAYANTYFSESVDKIIHISNQCALQESESNRQKMVIAAVRSSTLEFYFWDDAYHLRKFGNFK
ncbi:TenA family protein [Candidatus Ichthyocystis sparus]|uniref:TenA family protein n=1 Tax=Candidatus Ichthyocystis sparus TaxID=1561004 RepID=UPI000B8509AC|nr:TenA family protein [Candidatus Ichthyocystis sparus]